MFASNSIASPIHETSFDKNPPKRPIAMMPIPVKPNAIAIAFLLESCSFFRKRAKTATNKGPEPITKAVTDAGTMLIPI